jgi:hypothetical protein
LNLTASEKGIITAVTAIISAVVAFVPSWNGTAQLVVSLLPTVVIAVAFLVDEIEKGTAATVAAASPKRSTRS